MFIDYKKSLGARILPRGLFVRILEQNRSPCVLQVRQKEVERKKERKNVYVREKINVFWKREEYVC